ncbi:MAG: hypothetical protein K8R63_12250, partial [Bacteroidales bacterium]|nr:hypothetical protein [Bacteroidales bacterium]
LRTTFINNKKAISKVLHIRNSYLINNSGSWIKLHAGCWLLDTRYWILDTGCWMLDAGYWILDAGCWMLDDRKTL